MARFCQVKYGVGQRAEIGYAAGLSLARLRARSAGAETEPMLTYSITPVLGNCYRQVSALCTWWHSHFSIPNGLGQQSYCRTKEVKPALKKTCQGQKLQM